jgi:uncharacterized protein (DUF697 family)
MKINEKHKEKGAIIMAKIKSSLSFDQDKKTLSEQQGLLLDELNVRLNKNQSELEQNNKIIQQQEANSIVKNHVWTSSAVGLIPLPIFDIFALSTTQVNMLHRLSEHYQLDFAEEKAKSAVVSLISGSLPTLTLLGLSSMIKVIPGMGTLGGNASLSLAGGAVTYATGQSFIKHFNDGGTIHDFQAKKFSQFFKQELKKGKHFVGNKSSA